MKILPVLILIAATLSLTPPNLLAQDKRIFFEVRTQNGILPNAWAGGINAVQYSEVDINDDGVKDLFAFDRVGNVAMTFLNTSTGYQFAPEYLVNFPKLKNWVLLRDYNRDGIEDIFAYSTVPGVSGIEVHTGFYKDGKIAFEKMVFPSRQFDILYFPLHGGASTQLYVSAIDIPALDDINGDNDLDILTFNLAGGVIEYYENQSVERGFGTDTLLFNLEEDCWGGIFESGISYHLDLSPVPGECARRLVGDTPVNFRHTGSTLTTIDMDNDCAKELLLGDLSFSHMVMAINGGDCNRAWINAQDTFFPSGDVPVDLPSFPASFVLDADRDGKRDLIATKNAENGGEDYYASWLYKNVGTNEFPDFELVQKDFLTDGMIDLGTGAFPAAVDYNADGLTDLVVGNESFFISGGSDKDSRLFLFENIGTAIMPAFELVDDNWLDMQRFTPSAGNSSGTWSFTPAFGDMDADGDLDLLIGAENGTLFYAENTAGPGQALNFPVIQENYMDIDVGRFSYPALGDVNRDGKMDIVVGEENARLNYYQNIGTPESPDFDPEENNPPNSIYFGQIDLREGDFNTGYGAPLLLDFGTRIDMIVGNEAGSLRYYVDINEDPDNAFLLFDDNFGDTHTGYRPSPAMGDFNNDWAFELIVGNYRGGLGAFRTILLTNGNTVNTQTPGAGSAFGVFPNPTKMMLYFQLPESFENTKMTMDIFNCQGVRVRHFQSIRLKDGLSVQDLNSGSYFFRISSGEGQWTGRFIKI